MRQPPTREDRLLRLKRRLGLRPPKFLVRIKPGGWITFPPGLGVRAGDRWEIESIGQRLVMRRLEPGKRPKRRQPRHTLAVTLMQMPDVGTDADFAATDIEFEPPRATGFSRAANFEDHDK